MIPKAAEVRLTSEDRAVLEARVRAPTTEQRDVFRARIILLAAEGGSTRSIARTVDTMPRTVSLWRGRFSREGLSGLADKPRLDASYFQEVAARPRSNRIVSQTIAGLARDTRTACDRLAHRDHQHRVGHRRVRLGFLGYASRPLPPDNLHGDAGFKQV
jgi:transposase-like protein